MPRNYFENIPKYVNLSKYAKIRGVTKKAVCHLVQNGYIDAKEINGVLHVKLDGSRDYSRDPSNEINAYRLLVSDLELHVRTSAHQKIRVVDFGKINPDKVSSEGEAL